MHLVPHNIDNLVHYLHVPLHIVVPCRSIDRVIMQVYSRLAMLCVSVRDVCVCGVCVCGGGGGGRVHVHFLSNPGS